MINAEYFGLGLWSALTTAGWEVAAAAALLSLIGLLAMRRPRSRVVGALARLTIVLIAVAASVGYFHVNAERERTGERRALEAREAELDARALGPGSALACLDGTAGEAVENACEKAVFAKPETTAAAVAYMAARLALLADAIALADKGDPQLAARLANLRRAIELDRFGLSAQVLARTGCTAENCAAFALLADAGAIRANLKARAFDAYVARYAADWTHADKAVAEKTPAAEAAQAKTEPAHPAPPFNSRYDFPSSASIPPVSIMNAEPPRPADDAPADATAKPPEPAEAGATGALPLPPKRPRAQAGNSR